MKSNYMNLKNGLKSLLAGLFLIGTITSAKAQCLANFTYVLGANGSVSVTSTSSGTTGSTAYSWTFNGLTAQGGSTASFTYSTNGPKTICLSIVSNTAVSMSCANSKCDSLVITNVATPTPCAAQFNYSAGPLGQINFNNTSIGLTGGTSYTWTFGVPGAATAHIINISNSYPANGSYLVCLTINSNTSVPGSCTSTFCDTVVVTNSPAGSPCVANFSHVTGANGSVSFASTSTGTTSGTVYSWNFAGASGSGIAPTHVFPTNGPKSVCLTISNATLGCTSTKCDSVYINNVSPTVTPCNPSVMYTLSKDSITPLTWNAYPAYPANITGATWSWGDGTTSTGLYPSHTYSAAGTYSTCVTVSVSCDTLTGTYCYIASIFKGSGSNNMIQVNVVDASKITGISSTTKNNNLLAIYPNPNSGFFTLELSGDSKDSKQLNISIYNMLGEKVLEQKNLSATKQTIDVNTLSNGTYFVKVSSENGLYTKKIMIQK